jgi:serine/threonine protein kinase
VDRNIAQKLMRLAHVSFDSPGERMTEIEPRDPTTHRPPQLDSEVLLALSCYDRSWNAGSDEGRTIASCTSESTSWHGQLGFGPGGLPPRLGRYTLIRLLGVGGMGRVFEALDEELSRRVALKISPAFDGLSDSSRLDRFLREARIVARLRHPTILPVYDVGQAGSILYIASQLVEGSSLGQRINDGPLPWHEAVKLIAQVCEGVQTFHDAQIVHRDIKPSNILLDQAGHPFLSDFGLARTFRSDVEASITCEGAVLGTPHYMAPEQVRGQIPLQGPTTDIYGLGATLYALLTGHPPHKAAGTMELFEQITSHDPAPPSLVNHEVPRHLDAVCMKAMSREPTCRYRTATEMAEDLRRVVSGQPILAARTKALRKRIRWAPSTRTLAVLLGLSLVYNAVLLRSGQHAPARVDRPTRTFETSIVPESLVTSISYKAQQDSGPAIARATEASFSRILEETERWLREHPDDPAAHDAAARALLSLGQAHRTAGRSREAALLYRRALELLTTLARQHPSRGYDRIEHDEVQEVLAVLRSAGGAAETDELEQTAQQPAPGPSSSKPLGKARSFPTRILGRQSE